MKKLTSMFLALLMVLTMVPALVLSASAAGVVPSSAKEYNGHTYYVKKGNYTWTSAKKYCENRGGHLVTITSSKENKFVNSLIKAAGETYYAIGLYNKNQDNNYKMAWVTGEKYKYKTWASGEPSIGSYGDCNYTYIQSEAGDEDNKKWRLLTANDDEIGGFIIEWDMSKKAANAFRMLNSTASVYYGSTVTLKTLNASGKITWKTSNKNVATVSSKGVVKGVGLGTCTISATNGKKTVKCKVTVKDRSSSASVSFKVNGGGYFIKGVSTAAVKFKMKSYNCAKVTVYIRNSQGENVYKKTFSKLKKGTYYSFNWNGMNTKDKYVPAGSYRVLIVSGSKKTYSSYLSFKTKNEFAGGNGSKASPFLVASTSQLKKIVKYPTGYFKQTKNLNFDYTAVGGFFTEDQPFNGVYDGGNKTISNVVANNPLFMYIGQKGTVKNLKMSKCSVISEDCSLLCYKNEGKITNCNINGTASYSKSDADYIYGGLIAVKNYGTITDCNTSGKVNLSPDDYIYAGGIVGINYDSGKIISSSSSADVIISASYDTCCGGICGWNKGFITDCEASGYIDDGDDDDDQESGGIAGCNDNQISNCYYTGSQVLPIAGDGEGVVS